MSIMKKQKLVEATEEEKSRAKTIVLTVLLTVVAFCIMTVSCVSCALDRNPTTGQMTNEQKVAYWSAKIQDENWYPDVTDNNNGILDGFVSPVNIRTEVNSSTKAITLYFISESGKKLENARLEMTSEYGTLTFDDTEDQWKVKFSEKNDVLFMTVTDINNKVVYYQNRKN